MTSSQSGIMYSYGMRGLPELAKAITIGRVFRSWSHGPNGGGFGWRRKDDGCIFVLHLNYINSHSFYLLSRPAPWLLLYNKDGF